MNIVEQRYDFLVDVRSFAQLDDVCLKRLLYKLHKHEGWLYNYLYYKLDLSEFSQSQQKVLNETAIRFYGKALR